MIIPRIEYRGKKNGRGIPLLRNFGGYSRFWDIAARGDRGRFFRAALPSRKDITDGGTHETHIPGLDKRYR